MVLLRASTEMNVDDPSHSYLVNSVEKDQTKLV